MKNICDSKSSLACSLQSKMIQNHPLDSVKTHKSKSPRRAAKKPRGVSLPSLKDNKLAKPTIGYEQKYMIAIFIQRAYHKLLSLIIHSFLVKCRVLSHRQRRPPRDAGESPPCIKASRSCSASSSVASTMSGARLVRFSENFPQPRAAPDTTAETPLPSASSGPHPRLVFRRQQQVKVYGRRPSQNQRHLRLPPNHQPRQHNPAAINPSAQFLRSDCPILLVDPPP